MTNQKFKDVYDFYSWGSQCNMLAPKFDDLCEDAKNFWIKSFNEHNARLKIMEKKSEPSNN